LPNIKYIYGNFGTLAEVPFESRNDDQIFRNHCFEHLKFIGERNQVEKPNLDNYEQVLFIYFGYDNKNLIDALSIQRVKRAKLIGMCKNLNPFYSDIEKNFKIKMVECSYDIKEFIRTELL
jgi:hypothetical protein